MEHLDHIEEEWNINSGWEFDSIQGHFFNKPPGC